MTSQQSQLIIPDDVRRKNEKSLDLYAQHLAKQKDE